MERGLEPLLSLGAGDALVVEGRVMSRMLLPWRTISKMRLTTVSAGESGSSLGPPRTGLDRFWCPPVGDG